MTPASLVIVADRGGLKAYKITPTPTRGPSLRLVDDFQITGLERDLPFQTGLNQQHVRFTKDWPSLETETNCRICQWLANRIARIVKTERAEGWSFAAEPAIHKAIVDLLPVAIRERIVEHVPSDLVKVGPAQLRGHFRSLRSIRSTAVGRRSGRARRALRRPTGLTTPAQR